MTHAVPTRRSSDLLLHSRRAERLRSKLLRDGDSDLIVVSLPWFLGQRDHEDAGAPHRSRPDAHRAGAQWDSRINHRPANKPARSEEHPSELQSLMRISSAVFCLTKNKNHYN